MEGTSSNDRFAAGLIGALAARGLRRVFLTPGSRNTPLTLAAASHPDIEDAVLHDERSAGFFAIGAAKATGKPAAVVTTSGTAAANLHPAAAEARTGRVPLLFLTADRPAARRDVGSPQTIDQVKLYGDSVKWFHDVAPDQFDPRQTAALGARAWATALDTPAGPVHLNVRFAEPLIAAERPPPGAPAPVPETLPGRLQPDEHVIAGMAEAFAGRRVLIVAGPQDDPGLGPALAELAGAGGYPVIADVLSQARAGTHDLSHVVAHAAALAAAGFLDRHPPEVVLRFGALPTAKSIFRWLADRPDVAQILVEPAGWRDPDAGAGAVLRADPLAAATALAKAVTGGAPAGWADAWRAADDATAAALRDVHAASAHLTEPGVAAVMAEAVPSGATLWAASSMPVRDLDTFAPRRGVPLRTMANRGANGIDGLISSGLGSALATAAPTYVLAGDLSVLHDLTALATAARLDIPATIVVVDNDGGGIFHFLPQAELAPDFERLFAAPHGLDLVGVGAALGVPAQRTTDPDALRAVVGAAPEGPRLVVVPTDRDGNVAVHRAATDAVSAALGRASL